MNPTALFGGLWPALGLNIDHWSSPRDISDSGISGQVCTCQMCGTVAPPYTINLYEIRKVGELGWTFFFCLKHVLDCDNKSNGVWEDLDTLSRRTLEIVILRLIRALEAGARPPNRA
ncbi:hypothetical protein ASPZODRAFT_164280 [Penicilliopsis zonata CBS 506.65]|uniref:Uncharacterized protein n=1 Tax=Penicilliopsis zonata CBS 506.65 TaxID=1073090 RepID=A0A1L9ST39_9EURO|nr:hypothetical protein ASPZODRAFT_164280 [Penicilliopsis zonata CBS 506.65]OJJ50306.1 hypothetical protein ASPZODRAFT_164280 [Penicilliopsis zonata CBS 506.65]